MSNIISELIGGGIVEDVKDVVNAVGDQVNKKVILKAAQESEELQAGITERTAQIDVNKIEAASEDKYTSRARPTIIYICGFGFGYQYILQPFLLFAITCLDKTIVIPTLDMTAIGTVLLGLCGLRSWDKKQG